MNRALFMLVSVGALLSIAPVARAGALEDAAARELALLAREQQELARVKEEIDVQRAARAAALRAQIATHEAHLVTALATQRNAEAEVAQAAAPPTRAADEDAALARIILAAQQRARGAATVTLAQALDVGLKALEDGVTSRRIDTGFFSVDGTFVDGAVLRVGAIGAVAASGASAGPAWITGGAFEVATQDARFVEQARLLVASGAAPAVPLALGHAPGSAEATPGFFAATARAGAPAAVALLLGALAFAVALVRAGALWRTVFGARRLAPRVASLVASGELGVAAAECRKAGGPAGRMLLAIIERARSFPRALERVEERASDVFLDESLALGRGGLVTTALLVASGCVALLGTLASLRTALAGHATSAAIDAALTGVRLEALIPLERAVLVGAPALLCAFFAHALALRARHELERAMVRTVDAVASTGQEVA